MAMKDGFTNKINEKQTEWSEKVRAIAEDIRGHKDNFEAIADYLSNYHFSMPIGIALRRFLCEKYAGELNPQNTCYTYILSDGKEVVVKDHTDEAYDIEKDDVDEYVTVFFDVVSRYNSDSEEKLGEILTRQEIRRLFKSTTDCKREKLFVLSFALHLDALETCKALNEVLGEQTYNSREPYEIIAYFCQSNEEFNSYGKYLQLCREFDEKKADCDAPAKDRSKNYTTEAGDRLAKNFDSEEELMSFLLGNLPEFHFLSETAYKEFICLYETVNSYIRKEPFRGFDYERTAEDVRMDIILKIADKQVITPESLALELLGIVIPREERVTYRKGKAIASKDFVGVSTGGGKKLKTTLMPKSVMQNLPVSDRLLDLIQRKKAVERKDLIFLKFYAHTMFVGNQFREWTAADGTAFISECNELLARCGMTGLYPGNRFENLVHLSLVAPDPYGMFGDIIYETFVI